VRSARIPTAKSRLDGRRIRVSRGHGSFGVGRRIALHCPRLPWFAGHGRGRALATKPQARGFAGTPLEPGEVFGRRLSGPYDEAPNPCVGITQSHVGILSSSRGTQPLIQRSQGLGVAPMSGPRRRPRPPAGTPSPIRSPRRGSASTACRREPAICTPPARAGGRQVTTGVSQKTSFQRDLDSWKRGRELPAIDASGRVSIFFT